MGIKKTFKVALSTSIALVLSLGTLSPAHATTSASGEICTIVGTSKNDKLKGTSGDDVICGLGGNDTMTGLGGDDHLDGGNGNDAIAGGDGNDDLEGGSGNDRLLGQGGNDELLGAAGNDYLDGGLAPDALDAGVGADTCIFAAEDTVADTCDNKAPTFSNVSFSSTSVDTNTSAQTIVVEFDVADNLAGIQDVQISIQLPSQAGTSSSPVRLSGDEMSAHYRATVTIPKYGDKGQWAVFIWTFDQAGNDNGNREIGKITQTGSGDNSAPTFSNVHFSKSSVNTNFAAQTIDVEFDVKDNLSGVSSVEISTQMPSQAGTSTTPVLVTGDQMSGHYTATVTIPRFGGKGTWRVYIWTFDHAGNDNGKREAGKILQTGSGDTKAPSFRNVSLSRSTVSSSSAAQNVTVEFDVTDNLSGIRDVQISIQLPSQAGSATTPVRVSGTEVSGHYTATVTIPKFGGKGKWGIFIWTFDNCGNDNGNQPAGSIKNQ